jgi:hypothetical protein
MGIFRVCANIAAPFPFATPKTSFFARGRPAAKIGIHSRPGNGNLLAKDEAAAPSL